MIICSDKMTRSILLNTEFHLSRPARMGRTRRIFDWLTRNFEQQDREYFFVLFERISLKLSISCQFDLV